MTLRSFISSTESSVSSSRLLAVAEFKLILAPDVDDAVWHDDQEHQMALFKTVSSPCCRVRGGGMAEQSGIHARLVDEEVTDIQRT